MKVSKEILDLPINEFEEVSHSLTFREWIKEVENELGIECADLDSMTDEELNRYEDFLFEMSLK